MTRLKAFQWVLWLNLILGFHNLYLFVTVDNWFNFIVGALNIGVWVFKRHYLFLKENKA